MFRLPDTKLPDNTFALLRDPYRFVSTRCRRGDVDLFDTRLLGRPTTCMTGPLAAELVYDEARFIRHGAPPPRVQRTLFGSGGVQGLDDEAHRRRKQMLMSLMTPERVRRLAELTADRWRRDVRRWRSKGTIVLYDELQSLLARVVCEWVGIPLADDEVARRARELVALFDYAGSVGPKHWSSRWARRTTNRWIEGVVGDIRAGRLDPPAGAAAHTVAWHRDGDGQLLSPHVAAVEILNVLRPTVAVAVYGTFVAHALHHNPDCRRRLAAGEPGYPDLFVQEVRRYYPFFPSVMAVARRDFEWQAHRFPAGRRVLLDLYGTNHDPRTWDTPQRFHPDRFRDRDEHQGGHRDGRCFAFIPQGGGDPYEHHRCAGEAVTVELMKVAADILTRHIGYHVPDQNLEIDYARLPAMVRSRFVIQDVHPVSPC